MIDLLSVPASIWAFAGGIVVAFIGVYFSRKRTAAEAASMITDSAMALLDKSDERMVLMEGEIDQLRKHSGKQSARISSLEHNEKENGKWIGQLERMTEKLQRDNKELRQQYDDLLARYRALKDEVEHGSRPDLRLEGS